MTTADTPAGKSRKPKPKTDRTPDGHKAMKTAPNAWFVAKTSQGKSAAIAAVADSKMAVLEAIGAKYQYYEGPEAIEACSKCEGTNWRIDGNVEREVVWAVRVGNFGVSGNVINYTPMSTDRQPGYYPAVSVLELATVPRKLGSGPVQDYWYLLKDDKPVVNAHSVAKQLADRISYCQAANRIPPAIRTTVPGVFVQGYGPNVLMCAINVALPEPVARAVVAVMHRHHILVDLTNADTLKALGARSEESWQTLETLPEHQYFPMGEVLPSAQALEQMPELDPFLSDASDPDAVPEA